eukprot:TRINITY_DN1528_c0_g2_i1.p1 TRINITY_DN1528_c0_g2~~TRINITY_DN1528_c0_g2_i1.p1  ORF type:complete len:489 (+),score=181.41 TRINITY_DN1528_c0_g2_i1:166-1632(+)
MQGFFLTTPRSLPEEMPLLGEGLGQVYSAATTPMLSPFLDRASSCGRDSLTVRQLVGLYAFCFGYGLCITSYALITFPAESVRFFPDGHDFGLALFMVLAGIAQLCGPAVGFFSDRCTHRMGKRRPFLIASGVTLMPCLTVQWYMSYVAADTHVIIAYYVSSFVGMVCLCTMQTVVVGFTPDLVPKHQTGQANGILVATLGCGAAAGFLLVILFPSLNPYLVYTVVLVSTTCLSFSHGEADMPAEWLDRRWRWDELAACYFISPSMHAAYFWLFLSRACYYTGVSTQSFLQYYFRDWVLYADGSHIEVGMANRYTAAAAFFSQMGLALSAVPAGRLSDKVGREVVLHVAAVGIACCYMLNVVVRDLWLVLFIAFVYGTLNGASLTVSYALAIDTLPNRENGAQWLAIWDVAAFIGSTVGPVLYGPALFFIPPRVPKQGYIANADGGYMVVMLMGGAFVLLGSVFLLKVSSSRAEASRQRRSARKQGVV